ncbi:hypothetical protein EPN42_16070 [bacterium]|nr:MAG: hypothetical protein EPN42_16070 [bacterium]
MEHDFRHAPQSDTRLAALGMWLSVQQARLRTHDPAHWQDHDGRQAHDIVESIPFVVTIRQATTPDIWAGAVRSELEHVRRSVAYIPDRRQLPAVDAEIRRLERELDAAERVAAQARAEAAGPMPASGAPPTPNAASRLLR